MVPGPGAGHGWPANVHNVHTDHGAFPCTAEAMRAGGEADDLKEPWRSNPGAHDEHAFPESLSLAAQIRIGQGFLAAADDLDLAHQVHS